MSNTIIAVISSILIAGFIAGMFLGIGIKTGIEPDELGVFTFVLDKICQTAKDIDNKISYNCGTFLTMAIIISVFAALYSAFVEIMRTGDWRIGLIIYGIGWVIGLLLILTHFS